MTINLSKLLQLKFVTQKWKCLHEIQVTQLKYYPFVLPIESAELQVNIDLHQIEYHCKSRKKIRKTKNNIQLCKNIYRWLTIILWEDVELKIYINGELFYEQKE